MKNTSEIITTVFQHTERKKKKNPVKLMEDEQKLTKSKY